MPSARKARSRPGIRSPRPSPTARPGTRNHERLAIDEDPAARCAELRDRVEELTAANEDLASLLVSTDIATVLVDSRLRIKRFTNGATKLLHLSPSDLGAPIGCVATRLDGADLAHDADLVLRTGTPVDRDVAAPDGRQYLVRVVPYRARDGGVQGTVFTLVDVTTLKATEHELRSARDQLQRLNQTLEQRIAERTKWLTLMHDVTREIAGSPSWDDALHRVLHRVCASERWQVGYVYLPDREAPDTLAPAISCLEDPRFRSFHEASKRQHYARGVSLPGRVYGDGIPVWVSDAGELVRLLPVRGRAAVEAGLRAAAALPIRVGQDVIAVLELFSDQPRDRDEVFENLMNDVSIQIGKVLEKERAAAELEDLVWREQQGLLHTLHDSLGQTLTGLGMLSSGLRQQLAGTDDAAAATARQIADQAQVALEQVRQLARGLFPVEIDPQGLLPALRELASTTESFHRVRVHVQGDAPAAVRDSRVATQLYRVAQEAVTNAVKHAHAGAIGIELRTAGALTTLRIVDDGIGIPRRARKRHGLGLRIMRYRATSIGGLLSIDSAPGGGTTVTCTLRETPRAGDTTGQP